MDNLSLAALFSISMGLCILTLLINTFFFRDYLLTCPGEIRYGEKSLGYGVGGQEEFIRDIDECARSRKKNRFLKMATGEGNVRAFTREVERSLDAAAKQHCDIQVLVGPILMLRNEDKTSALIELFKLNRLKLYVRNARGVFPHFHVGSNDHVYVEDPHPMMARTRRFRDFTKHRYEAKQFSKLFDRLTTSNQLQKVEEIESRLHCLTEHEVEDLVCMLGQLNKNVDDLDFIALKPYVERTRGLERIRGLE